MTDTLDGATGTTPDPYLEYDDPLASDDTASNVEVIGEAQADKRLRARRALMDRIERHQRTADAHKADIDDWLHRVNGPLLNRVAHLDWWLHNWHEVQLIRSPKEATTIVLPAGTLEAREAKVSIRPVDKGAARAWLAEAAPDLLRPPKPGEPDVDIAAMKKQLGNRVQVLWDGDTGSVYIDGAKVPGLAGEWTEGSEKMAGHHRTWQVKA